MQRARGPRWRVGGPAQPNEWYRRPLLSRVLRTLVVLVPIAASWAIAVVISRALPPANSVSTAVLWVAVIAVTSLVTLVLFERAARRLLPLAALLDVSLLFPDRAPARFAVALRTAVVDKVREQAEYGAGGGISWDSVPG